MKEKMLEILLLMILGTFLIYDNVFAINEDYFDSLTYDKVANVGGHYYHNSNNLNFSKVLSIHSFEGPFYSFNHTNTYGQNEGYTEFYKFELTKDFDSVFDIDLLVEYDKLYYLELIYYTKNINLTNLKNGELNAPNNFSFITNDFNTFYNNYEVFEADWDLLKDDFYSTTHLDTYITYGRTQCKIADEDKGVYKCRMTYQINPNIFHKSADNPDDEVKGAELVFRLNDKVDEPYSNNFIAISELGWHSELAGTDDMIPEIEDFPFQEFDPDGDKTILDYIADIFSTIISLPSKIGEFILNGLKELFIPSDIFLEVWFNDLRISFDDQLGFLSYPFTLILDVLDKFLTLEDTGSYIIEWPNISVPNFEDYVIIKGGCYDLAVLLGNPTIKSMHDLYMLITNALIILAFLNLCLNTINRIFGGSVDNYECLSIDEGYNIDSSTGEVTGQWSNVRRITRKKVR